MKSEINIILNQLECMKSLKLPIIKTTNLISASFSVLVTAPSIVWKLYYNCDIFENCFTISISAIYCLWTVLQLDIACTVLHLVKRHLLSVNCITIIEIATFRKFCYIKYSAIYCLWTDIFSFSAIYCLWTDTFSVNALYCLWTVIFMFSAI